MVFQQASLDALGVAVGAAVLHFLWQGLVIGALTWIVLAMLRKKSFNARYAVAYGAMLLSLVAFVVTLFLSVDISAAGDFYAGAIDPALFDELTLDASLSTATIAAWLWAAGTFCMGLRFGLQCFAAQRLKFCGVSAPGEEWSQIFEQLKSDLGIGRAVRFLRSSVAEVPMVVGWISPVVLVPVSAFTSLSSDQLRALLAHELAHIRRHDHLLNALQAVVEIVLFFHPVVWWISKQVRDEREYCCDDSSVKVTGDPKFLAEALTTLETLRIQQPGADPVLAATGGPLMKRIQRILGAELETRSSLPGWRVPAGLLIAGFLAFAGGAYAAPAQERGARAQDEADAQDTRRDRWDDMIEKTKKAIADGVISKEDGRKKIAGILERKKLAEEQQKAEKLEAIKKRMETAKAQLDELVKKGEISQEDADKRMIGLREAIAKRREKGARGEEIDLEGIGRRIRLAIADGKITAEQGRERMAGARARAAAGNDKVDNRRAEYGAFAKRMEEAVKAGAMTEEEAEKQLIALRERMWPKDKIAKSTGSSAYEIFEAGIIDAVKAGELSRAQAGKLLEGYKKRMGEKTKKNAMTREEIGAAMKKIEAAVEAGEITPDEARARMQRLRKALDGLGKDKVKQEGRERRR